jgi:hypothetical protein
MVKGSDAADDLLLPVDQRNEATDNPSPEMSDAGSDTASDFSDTTDQAGPSSNPSAQSKKKRGKAVETMSSMVTRIKAFLKVCSKSSLPYRLIFKFRYISSLVNHVLALKQ